MDKRFFNIILYSSLEDKEKVLLLKKYIEMYTKGTAGQIIKLGKLISNFKRTVINNKNKFIINKEFFALLRFLNLKIKSICLD